MMSFELGGIEIPLEQCNCRTKYTELPVLRKTLHTMGDGGRNPQIYEGQPKLDITITGVGAWSPIALAGLDYSQQHLYKSGKPRSTAATGTNQIALPVTRRVDAGYEPTGWYTDGEGRQRNTVIADTTGDVATLVTVLEAKNYFVQYYPQIMVDADLIQDVLDTSGSYSWVLQLREL